MISKLTRDIIQSEIADFFAGVVEIHTELGGPNTVEEAQNQLTERVLACVPVVDSEPVAEVVSMFGDPEAFGEREIKLLVGIQNMPYGTKFYRHAQPEPERDQVRREHDEWSQKSPAERKAAQRKSKKRKHDICYQQI